MRGDSLLVFLSCEKITIDFSKMHMNLLFFTQGQNCRAPPVRGPPFWFQLIVCVLEKVNLHCNLWFPYILHDMWSSHIKYVRWRKSQITMKEITTYSPPTMILTFHGPSRSFPDGRQQDEHFLKGGWYFAFYRFASKQFKNLSANTIVAFSGTSCF